MTLRLTVAANAALDAVAGHYGLDRSSTLRWLAIEKERELGLSRASMHEQPMRRPRKAGAR